jgi:polar amino acid transport system permease protein
VTTLSNDERAIADLSADLELAGERGIVRHRHYGRAVVAALVVLLLLLFVWYGFVTNPNIDWAVVREYLFDPNILRGLWTTLEITLIGMVISVAGALVVALMRMSPSRIVRWFAWFYIFTFRGIPIILLLILVGNIGLFVRTIKFGIPFTDVTFFERSSASLVTPFVASIIGLSLAGSAYMAEIVRGGLLSVGKGQREAAKALGLTAMQATRYVVIPPALRVIVPPMGNEFISLLKASAIVSVIGGGDILTITQRISGINYRTIEMLLVAAFWYFVVIGALSIGQHFLEQRTAER